MRICAIVLAATLPVFDFATNSIAQRIAGADPAVCLSRFVDYPPSKGKLGFPRCLWEKPFPANDKFWLRGVDFSCVSPWNDESGTTRAGTAISRRHIVFAKHFPLWKGVRIVFVGEDGGVCPAQIEATKGIDDSDIMIGLLNYELTPNIKPARVLPEDFAKYIGMGRGLPVVTFNQQEKALLMESNPLPTNMVQRLMTWSHVPKNAKGTAFWRKIVGGDSGNPAFLLIGNEPILLYCLQGGGSGCGSGLHLYRKEVQAAMDELCPGYRLETFDFGKVVK